MDATADKLVKVYIKMRDFKAQLKAKYDEDEAGIKAQMDIVEAQLLELHKTTGTESLRTKYGTATRGVQTRYWTSDWEAMHKFIMEHNTPDLLERRVAQGQMKEFLKDNPDTMPIGMNIDSRYTVTVRRSK